ncbi:hypothetical protein TSOC_003159 [Tetrabaena socialis]|uniref:Uncharacterized protein n=1 Tax=Tetrabaena socialis TaxID=47790 RepID=A0A2J8AC89_9CHLO|nr:hypothetical protein TSOC_003159 [Tetrabaena socialis]|eukprot:PNH10129.1 hypothetical protein TSOC_003159 [Tetrabaena socialis]
MPTTLPTLKGIKLDPPVLLAIAAALPALTRLRVLDAEAASANKASAAGLVTLFGHEAGAAAAEGGARPVPFLAALELHGAVLHDLGELGPALRSCAHLRELHLASDTVWHDLPDKTAAQLAALTQLKVLRLGNYPREAVPRLCAALPGLTGLGLGNFRQRHQAAASLFTALRGLQCLNLGDSSVSVSGLSALVQLTCLEVFAFAVPAQPPRDTHHRWMPPPTYGPRSARGLVAACPLPPLLRRLVLHGKGHRIEVLAALQAPACLEAVELRHCEPELWLRRDASVVSDVGVLQLGGEAALLAAFSFLAAPGVRPRPDTLSLIYFSGGGNSRQPCQPLRPLPHGGGSGGGPAHHGAWLAVLGSLGVRKLRLDGVDLNEQDLRTMVQHAPTLEELTLGGGRLPAAALPVLASLPRLQMLQLGAQSVWPQLDTAPRGPINFPPEAPQVLLALCTAAVHRCGLPLRKLRLASGMQTRRDLPALEQQAKQLLRAAGLDPRMLVVQWGREESIIEDTPMYEEDEEYAESDDGFDSEDDEEGAYERREMERRHERREFMLL